MNRYRMDKQTYIPKRILQWLPTLGSNEAKVFMNLCSWTDKSDRQGRVYMDTLASGIKGAEEKGCNMPERSVRRIIRRLEGRGVVKVYSGKGRRYPGDEEGKKGILYMMQDAKAVSDSAWLTHVTLLRGWIVSLSSLNGADKGLPLHCFVIRWHQSCRRASRCISLCLIITTLLWSSTGNSDSQGDMPLAYSAGKKATGNLKMDAGPEAPLRPLPPIEHVPFGQWNPSLTLGS